MRHLLETKSPCDVRSGISPGGEAILQIVRLSGRVKGDVCQERKNMCSGGNFSLQQIVSSKSVSYVINVCIDSRVSGFLFILIDASIFSLSLSLLLLLTM